MTIAKPVFLGSGRNPNEIRPVNGDINILSHSSFSGISLKNLKKDGYTADNSIGQPCLGQGCVQALDFLE